MRVAAAGGAPAGVTEASITSWNASGDGRPVEPTSSAPRPSAAAVSDVAGSAGSGTGVKPPSRSLNAIGVRKPLSQTT